MSQDEAPKDHVESDRVDHGGDDRLENAESLEANLRSKATWLRLLFMIIMVVLFSLACMVGSVIVILQFFWVLFTGETKREFRTVGHQLALYAAETIDYLTFNTDERPFPFGRDWPS